MSAPAPMRSRSRERRGRLETVEVLRTVPRWRKIAALVSVVGVGYLFSRGAEMLMPAIMSIAVPIMLPLNYRTRLRWRSDLRVDAWAERRGWPPVTVPSAYARRWSGPPFGGVQQVRLREVISGPVEGTTLLSATMVLPGERRPRRTGTPRRRPAWFLWWGRASWRTWRCTAHVVVVDLPGALPEIAVTPHGDDRPTDRPGQDIDTESIAFNRAWRVQGTDVRAVHGMLHPGMIDLLMQPVMRGAHLRTEGASLLVWWPGPTDLDLLDARLAAVAGLARRIPRHLWQDLSRPV